MPSGPYGTIEPGDIIGLLTDPGVQNAIRAIVPAGWTLPSTSAVGDAPVAGGFGAWAQADHVHGREAFGGPGSATTVAHSDILPIGTPLPWLTATPPAGGFYLMMDGSAISRTTYSVLNAMAAAVAYASPWGAGDGVTTFNVPDWRGRSIIGAGLGVYAGATSHPLGQTGGEETHTLTVAEMPSHNHPVPATANAGGGPNFTEGAPFASTDSTNMGSTGGGGAHNTYHPFMATNWIIRAL